MWRYTQLPVRFFFLDFRAGFLFLLLMMHFRLWTGIVCVLGIAVFCILEKKGLSVPQALSRLRHAGMIFVGGRRRPGCALLKNRRWKEG